MYPPVLAALVAVAHGSGDTAATLAGMGTAAGAGHGKGCVGIVVLGHRWAPSISGAGVVVRGVANFADGLAGLGQ